MESITIHVAALSHPYINALRPYVPLFTEMTGINVVYDILPVEEFWTKTAADLQGGTGFYDLVQNGSEFEWAYAEAGWTEDLNKFLNDPKLTDLAWYDVNDFYPADWALPCLERGVRHRHVRQGHDRTLSRSILSR